MHRNIISRTLAAIVLILCFSTSFAASAQWRSYSNSAFATAKSQNKLVLVYGMSESCHWCTKMSNDTLSNSEITNLISKRFVPVTIDVVNSRSLANQYQIQGTPTFIILDSNRNKVSESYGYQSVSEFKSFLQKAN